MNEPLENPTPFFDKIVAAHRAVEFGGAGLLIGLASGMGIGEVLPVLAGGAGTGIMTALRPVEELRKRFTYKIAAKLGTETRPEDFQ